MILLIARLFLISILKLGYTPDLMWRVASRIFLGMLAGSVVTNAIAVYLLHDVDSDQLGKLNYAYLALMLEFLIFAIALTAIFLFAGWIGSLALKLPVNGSSPKLDFVLGIGVILIQYPAEFMVRKMNSEHTSENFLLAYLLLAPIFCAAIILLVAHRRRLAH